MASLLSYTKFGDDLSRARKQGRSLDDTVPHHCPCGSANVVGSHSHWSVFLDTRRYFRGRQSCYPDSNILGVICEYTERWAPVKRFNHTNAYFAVYNAMTEDQGLPAYRLSQFDEHDCILRRNGSATWASWGLRVVSGVIVSCECVPRPVRNIVNLNRARCQTSGSTHLATYTLCRSTLTLQSFLAHMTY